MSEFKRHYYNFDPTSLSDEELEDLAHSCCRHLFLSIRAILFPNSNKEAGFSMAELRNLCGEAAELEKGVINIGSTDKYRERLNSFLLSVSDLKIDSQTSAKKDLQLAIGRELKTVNTYILGRPNGFFIGNFK